MTDSPNEETHCCEWHKRFSGVEIERCEFCGKDVKDVQFLVAGPRVFICNECVDLCCNIIAQGWKDKAEALEERRKMDQEASNAE